jgi:hypothetical protein
VNVILWVAFQVKSMGMGMGMGMARKVELLSVHSGKA